MKKLILENYSYEVKNQQGISQLFIYNFKDVLINILTHHTLGLNGPELLEVLPLANKIEKADLEVILTDDDYDKIIDTCKRFRGFAKNDIPFLKRIYNCPGMSDDGEKVINIFNKKEGG